MKSVATERSIEVVDQFAMTTRDTLKHHPKTIIPDGAHLSDSNYNQLGHNLSLPMVNYADLRKVTPLNSLALILEALML